MPAAHVNSELDPLLRPLAEKLLQHHPESSLEELVGAFDLA